MKRFFTILTLILVPLVLKAQSQRFGNEWINFSQSYYKIKVAEDGVYRLDYSTLNAAGLPISSINVHNFQLYLNGTEQFIYIHGDADNSFDAGDYIEFFGRKNNGDLDSQLYISPEQQPHRHYSLYTDTSTYYLTWTSSTPGKRYAPFFNNNYSGFAAEVYFMHEETTIFTELFSDGGPYGSFAQYAEYTYGEGWLGNLVTLGTQQNRNINSRSLYSGGPTPQLEFKIFGKSDAQAPQAENHHIQLLSNNNTVLYDYKAKGYFNLHDTIDLDVSHIGNPLTTLRLKSVNDMNAVTDVTSISYFKLIYPRSFDIQNSANLRFSFRGLQTGSSGLLQFTNFPGSKVAPFLYDMTSGKRIRGTTNGTTASFIAPDQGSLRDMYLWDSSDIRTITKVQEVKFREFDPTTQDFQYVIITNEKLLSGSISFADYKKQQGFDTVIVTMSQLYEQFAYGQQGHPIAIRHFADYILEKSAGGSHKPEYVLYMGKGQTYDRLRKNPENHQYNLVPAWGVPPSDHLFTSGLGNTFCESPFAIARLPVLSNDQINIYLTKLKEHNNLPPDPERKNLLHIAAGRTSSENSLFKSYLNSYKDVAEDTLFGAKVTTYTSSDNFSNTDLKTAIVTQLNKKSLIMNYFGHGAANTIEIDIGQENDINPVPLFFFGGCLLGNTFADISLAERYLFAPGKGVITWIAGSSYGFPKNTADYTLTFYKHLFQYHYGTGLGNVMMQTIADYQDSNDVFNLLMNRDMLLFGDPSIVLYSPKKPDFLIPNNGISVLETNVSTDNDSFHLSINVRNAGVSRDADSLRLRVTRTFGGKTVTYPVRTYPNVRNSSIINYLINGEGELSKGMNEFIITIDPANQVDELSPDGENNNEAYFTFFLNSSGVSVIRPQYNSIVPNTNVTLLAQSGNLFIKTDYVFELDTVPMFNSPFKKTSPLITANHIAKWQTTLLSQDSTVYYWRVKYASDTTNWASSVFTYIQGSPRGWASFNFDQSSKSDFNDLIIDTTNKSFSFHKDAPIVYRVNTSGSAVTSGPAADRKIRYINASTRFGLWGNGIIVMAFDPIHGKRYIYPSTNSTSANNSGDPYYSTGFSGNYYFNTTTQVGRDSLVNHLKRIPEDYYVIAHNGPLTGIETWDSSVFNAFYTIGANRITDVREGHPYAIFGQKGMNKGEANEQLANPDTVNFKPQREQAINASFFVIPTASNGSYFTEKIGPAKTWKYFYAKTGNYDNPKDKVDASIYAYDTLGNEVQLFSGIVADTLDLASIDATKYPFLKIRYLIYDDSMKSPATVFKTAVLYEGLPEGTLNPDIAFTFHKDTLNQGDSLSFRMGFQNIGELAMDSVQVEITIRKDGVPVYYDIRKYQGLVPDSAFVISRTISTMNMSGKMNFELAVNNGFPLKEHSLVNNFYARSFYVKGDEINPLLDVTADGLHIMDNDIISPNPVIRITVSDDNSFFLLDDSTAADLFIKMPGNTDFTRISYTDPALVFQPATANNNKAFIEYRPQNWPSGVYEMKVMAKDKAGNQSGNAEYHVRFRIIRESSITNIYPYPNPFTTQCRFVFTLTGETLPDQLRIQIMTVSGRVVKEIDLKADGNLRLGNNISTYTWDGTDQFGDRLANGVYLYTVTARINGKDIKLMETAGDVTFNNGYGKIYLMK